MQAIVGRLAIMDALLDLCVVTACCAGSGRSKPHDRPDDGGAAPGRLRARRGGAGLGTLAKGPVAPVIVVLVIGVWLVWERRSNAPVALPLDRSAVAAAVVLFAAVAPWFVLEAFASARTRRGS